VLRQNKGSPAKGLSADRQADKNPGAPTSKKFNKGKKDCQIIRQFFVRLLRKISSIAKKQI
jgi:hypothetical protein